MKLGMGTFVLLNVVLIAFVVLIVVGASWFLLNTNLDTTEAEYKVKTARLQASATVYYDRLGFYTGLCDDIGVPENFSCAESDGAYVIEAEIDTGTYYCLDSTGFAGKTRIPKGTGMACRH